MRARIELLSEAVFEVDANGLIVFMSSASITMLGKHPGVCLHLSLPDLVSAEDRPGVERLLHRDNPLPRKLRARMPRADGSEAWVLISLTPIDSGGAVGVLHDITAEKQAADEFAQLRDQVAAAAVAKSAFIANVSHEIRTPLAAIIGLSHLCLGTRLTEKQRDYLTKTEQAAQDLFQIVNDILDFSKMEAGGLKLETIPFALRSVFANVDALMRPLARAKGLELQMQPGDGLPAVLNGDPLRLEQIILNLVSNAIKFTSSGSICVSAEIHVQDASGVLLEFSVADTGIGLLPTQTSMIFQAFSQADSSSTRQFGGTGLGLAICRRLVEKKGGSICRSGARPASAAPFTSRPATPGPRSRPAARFTSNCRTLRRTPASGSQCAHPGRRGQPLQPADHHGIPRGRRRHARRLPITAPAPAGARQQPRFDAILMDVQMPVMDGTRPRGGSAAIPTCAVSRSLQSRPMPWPAIAWRA